MDTVIVWIGGSLLAVLAALVFQAIYAGRPREMRPNPAAEPGSAGELKSSAFALSSVSH